MTKDCPFKNDKVYQNKPKEYKNVEEEFARFVEDAEGSSGRAKKLIDQFATNQIIDRSGQRAAIKTSFVTDEVDPAQFLKLTYS